MLCGSLLYFLVYFDSSKVDSPKITLNNPKVITPIPTPHPTIQPIILDTIFKNKPNLSNFNKNELVTLVATGDFIPARTVNTQTKKYNNFLWSVENVKGYFTNADIVFVDLEAPIFENCPQTDSGFVFCGDRKHISALKEINTSIVNLANNHLSNYGVKGIEDTQKLLTENQIKYTGADNLEIIEKNGTTFGFLGYNDIGYTPPQLSSAKNETIISDIKIAKEKCDVLIVTFHFGTEYEYLPDKRQVELAHLVIDNGGDLVVGNHPHTIQPIEIYKDKVIMYAHGNFVFDQMWSEQTKQGVAGYYTFYKQKLVGVDFKPIFIEDFGKATIPDEKMSRTILQKLEEISYGWKEGVLR